MSLPRRTTRFSLALVAACASGVASGDVIRPSGAPSLGTPAPEVPEIARSGPMSAPLTLSKDLLGPDWRTPHSPLMFEGLIGSALDERTSAPAVADARLPLPGDRLLGASKEPLAPVSAARGLGLADGASTPSVRVPEPASVTLVLAGVIGIGLVARSRLRRAGHAPKADLAPANALT